MCENLRSLVYEIFRLFLGRLWCCDFLEIYLEVCLVILLFWIVIVDIFVFLFRFFGLFCVFVRMGWEIFFGCSKGGFMLCFNLFWVFFGKLVGLFVCVFG